MPIDADNTQDRHTTTSVGEPSSLPLVPRTKTIDEVPVGSSEIMVHIPIGPEHELTLFAKDTPLFPEIPAPVSQPNSGPLKSIDPPGAKWGKPIECRYFKPEHSAELAQKIDEEARLWKAIFKGILRSRIVELLMLNAVNSNGLEIATQLHQAYPENETFKKYTNAELWKKPTDNPSEFSPTAKSFLNYAINQPPFQMNGGNYKFINEILMQSEGAQENIKHWHASGCESLRSEFGLTGDEVAILKNLDQWSAALETIGPEAAQRHVDRLRGCANEVRKVLDAHYNMQRAPHDARYRAPLTGTEARSALERYISTLFTTPVSEDTVPALNFVRQGFNKTDICFNILPGQHISAFRDFNAKEFTPAIGDASPDGILRLPVNLNQNDQLRFLSHEIAHAFIAKIYKNKRFRPWSDRHDPREKLWKEAIEADLRRDKTADDALTQLRNDIGFGYTPVYHKVTVPRESMAYIIDKMVKDEWYKRPDTGESLAETYPHLTAFVKDIVFKDGEYYAKHDELPEINADEYRLAHPAPPAHERREERKKKQESHRERMIMKREIRAIQCGLG